jgi:hypothetical protein
MRAVKDSLLTPYEYVEKSEALVDARNSRSVQAPVFRKMWGGGREWEIKRGGSLGSKSEASRTSNRKL